MSFLRSCVMPRRWLCALFVSAAVSLPSIVGAQTTADHPSAPARPVAVADLLQYIAGGMPKLVVLSQVRRNCLATAISAADEKKLFSAGIDSAFVAQLRNSCVAAAVIQAAVVDANGGMLTASVQAQQLNCERGSYTACDSVADKYLEGIFAPKSPTKAAEFLLKACAAGRDQACWRAVDILDASANEADNREGARVLLERCDRSDKVACRRLGRFREEGHGVAKDGVMALTLYKSSCDANDAEACCSPAH